MDESQHKPSPLPDDDDATRLLPSGSTARLPPAGPGAASDNAHALAAGTRLHEFEITEVLGEGGFGIVYLARDLSLSRTVAIKEYMPSSLADRTGGLTVSVRSDRHADTFQAGLRSFVNEAKMLAHFDHPSLLKVHRFWEANGTAYMAMPYYRGHTLKARMQQDGPPPTEAWLRQLLAPLLDALKLLHSENCFHRDIAPDNILLLADDRPVLLDFGAARQVIGDMTQGLTVILKSGYAPIEQYAEINTLRQGPWTDLYALGASLHMVLTGKPPAPAVQRMLGDQVVPLAQRLKGQYSDNFLAAIDAVLRVSPSDRPQDVAAFEALLSWPAAPVPPPPEAAPEPQSAPEPVHLGREAHEHRPAALVRPVATSRSRIRHLWVVGGTTGVLAAIGLATMLRQPREGSPGSPVEPMPAASVSAITAAAAASSLPLSTAPQPTLAEGRVETASSPSATEPTPSVAAQAPQARAEVASAPDASTAKTPAAATPRIAVAKPTKAPPAKPPAPPARSADAAPLAPPPMATPELEPAGADSAQSPRSAQLKSLVSQSRQKLNERKFGQAATLAERALALEPGHPLAAELLQRAREGQRQAFDEIKIE